MGIKISTQTEGQNIRKVHEDLSTGASTQLPSELEFCKSSIIDITGKPGIGKYTIAKILSGHGFIICDNQLINNPVFALLNYNGFTSVPEFAWDAIANIRNAVLDFIAIEKKNSYIITNNLYENDGDRRLYGQVKKMAENRGSTFWPIRLMISEEEHLRRITQLERQERWKSIDPNYVYDQTPLLKIDHPNMFELEVSKLSAKLAAEQILTHIRKS